MKTSFQRFKARAAQTSQQIKTDLDHVKQFASDGCTGVPDFIFYECCESHDWDYWFYSTISRFKADTRLFCCMKLKLKDRKRVDDDVRANWWLHLLPYVYFIGVRVLGYGRYKGKSRG